MRLSLTIVCGIGGGGSGPTSKTWADCGGTIGRADDCDWVLADPAREISRCHAKVRFMNGGFYLEDASANGVFVNDRENRLNPGELHRLADGERLFISEYQIAVRVDEDSVPVTSDESASRRPDPAYDSDSAFAGSSGDYAQWDPLASLGGEVDAIPTPIEPSSGGQGASQPYLEEHFAPPPVRPAPAAPQQSSPGEDTGASSSIPSDWWQQPGPQSDVPLSDLSSDPPRSAPVSDDDRQRVDYEQDPLPASTPGVDSGDAPQTPFDSRRQAAPGEDVVPPQSPPRPEPPPIGEAGEHPPNSPARPPAVDQQSPAVDRSAPQGRANADYEDALAVLLQGAGIDAEDLTEETAEELGRILRVVVVGVMDLLRARSELKNEFRMPATLIQARENNPLKFSTNAEDALHNLLVKHNPDYLGPVAAFESSFDDLRAHQMAILAGMREAFMEMLNRFDPETLERQFEEGGRQGAVMGRIGRKRNWDMFKELFGGIRQDLDANFHRLFGESFIRAYESQMVRLQQSSGDRRD